MNHGVAAIANVHFIITTATPFRASPSLRGKCCYLNEHSEPDISRSFPVSRVRDGMSYYHAGGVCPLCVRNIHTIANDKN